MISSITHPLQVAPLALLLDRLTPGLYTPQPGETPAETAARWDAATDIVNELLVEIADEHQDDEQLVDWSAAA